LKEIGGNYYQDEDYQKAITFYQQSLEIYNKNNDTLQQAIVLRKIGAAYYHLFDFDKTLEYFLKALKILEHINDQDGMLKTLVGIGNTYTKCYNNKKALEYYLKAYKISEQTGNKKGLYVVLNNIGIVYFLDLKDYDKALEYFNKSLLVMKENNDSSNISSPIQNIALIYYKMQKYDTALNYLFEALNLNEKFNNKQEAAIVTNNIANIYIITNDLVSAKKYLDRSLKISKEIDSKIVLKNNYFLYTLFYALKGDLINMQKYSDLYDALTDTIFNEESHQNIARMQTIYETGKKEQQIEMLNFNNKLKEVKLQARTYWLMIFIIAFALVVILLIFLFIQKRSLLFANKTLVQKNLEIVATEKKLIDDNIKLHTTITGDENISKKKNENIAIKYAGSTLLDNQKKEIRNSIINYMNHNKSYLNIDYTLNTLANDLEIKRKYISQVINESFNQNFSNFLNEYRVKEARKIITTPNNFNYTIEAIAGLVGYRSKTAFNNAFKKYVGVTPSFYIKSIKNNTGVDNHQQ
ncbi:MAG: tetratricopeptide repeat protein, partial [Bacteroidales bacterium]|nr:tetratricopeptide repeat protein [Bacteroidales bacterium]